MTVLSTGSKVHTECRRLIINSLDLLLTRRFITSEGSQCATHQIKTIRNHACSADANWFANDASASGTGLPYELDDGAYTFEFTLPGSVCVQSIQVDITTACLGDFNLNGERDVVDLLVILAGLPGGALETAFSEEADSDCDGAVTVNDMLTFLTVFGTLCD